MKTYRFTETHREILIRLVRGELEYCHYALSNLDDAYRSADHEDESDYRTRIDHLTAILKTLDADD